MNHSITHHPVSESRRTGRAALIALCLMLCSPLTLAETLYVTDILRLGMYPNPNADQEALRVLASGDALEVLERAGSYTRVRTTGGSEGWVKASYLVEEIPSKTRLAELNTASDSLRSEVAMLRAGLAERDADLINMRVERDQLLLDIAAVKIEMEELGTRNATLAQQIDNVGIAVPLQWIALSVFLALAGGFIGGWWWTDARQRARHGGYRI